MKWCLLYIRQKIHFLWLCWWIGHFRITVSLFFKASPGAHPFIWKLVFIHMQMKTNFRMKRWAPGLALKKRPEIIRKWPIGSCLERLCWSTFCAEAFLYFSYVNWFVLEVSIAQTKAWQVSWKIIVLNLHFKLKSNVELCACPDRIYLDTLKKSATLTAVCTSEALKNCVQNKKNYRFYLYSMARIMK